MIIDRRNERNEVVVERELKPCGHCKGTGRLTCRCGDNEKICLHCGGSGQTGSVAWFLWPKKARCG